MSIATLLDTISNAVEELRSEVENQPDLSEVEAAISEAIDKCERVDLSEAESLISSLGYAVEQIDSDLSRAVESLEEAQSAVSAARPNPAFGY